MATVPIAVILFDFDPYAQLFGDLTVSWGAIALAGVIAAALLLAGILARAAGLRADDVVFIAVGIVPGAVIGGRLGYLIVHSSYYGSTPAQLLDPAIGGLELGLAVVGGFVTGAYVASLLGASVGRWLHVAAAPLLFALGAGKLAMVLTGTGQGVPSDAAWATAYLGPGPWGSLVPALPSVPSQALEGIATLGILAVLTLALMVGVFGRRDGAAVLRRDRPVGSGQGGGVHDLARSDRRRAAQRHRADLDRHRDRLRRGAHRAQPASREARSTRPKPPTPGPTSSGPTRRHDPGSDRQPTGRRRGARSIVVVPLQRMVFR